MEKCCKICGNSNYVSNTRNYPEKFCSYSCYEYDIKFNRVPNYNCKICNTPFFAKESKILKSKQGIADAMAQQYGDYVKNN
jgi:hypothetical protein